MKTISAQGVTYNSPGEALARIAVLEEQNAAYGPSDGRMTEINLIQYALAGVEVSSGPEMPTPAPKVLRYEGMALRNEKTGITHFVNDWQELFCGKNLDWMPEIGKVNRVTCGTCQKAADAWIRDDMPARGGSPARRA